MNQKPIHLPISKKRTLLLFPLVILLSLGSSQSSYSNASDWQTLAPGIEYAEFKTANNSSAYVTRMDRNNPNVIMDTGIAQGQLAQGTEAVSGMAQRYDQAINTWGKKWGPRNHVVVAINGSFYDPRTGIPETGMVQSGWYSKMFDDKGGSSGLVWKYDRTLFIGECVEHFEDENYITLLTNDKTMDVESINTYDNDDFTIYTPQFSQSTRTETKNRTIEVLVEMNLPARLIPEPHMTTGIIRKIRDKGDSTIPFNYIVLSSRGNEAFGLREHAQVGDSVGITYELQHYNSGCRGENPADWTLTYASLGGSFIFLKNGEIKEIDDRGALKANPRTAICYNDEFVYFVVVDGRGMNGSGGVTISQLGEFCRDTLDTQWGINQDGGGSSTMWVNGEVMNSPSDGGERGVANAWMMIVVEPKEESFQFIPGDRGRTREATQVRIGPGTNYASIAEIPNGTDVRILYQINNLYGVLAKGANWWYVDAGDSRGWVREDSLSPLQTNFPFPNQFPLMLSRWR